MTWIGISAAVCASWWFLNLVGSLINSPDWSDSKKRNRFVMLRTNRHQRRETRPDGGVTIHYEPEIEVLSGPAWLWRSVDALMLMRAQAPYVAGVLALAALLREIFGAEVPIVVPAVTDETE